MSRIDHFFRPIHDIIPSNFVSSHFNAQFYKAQLNKNKKIFGFWSDIFIKISVILDDKILELGLLNIISKIWSFLCAFLVLIDYVFFCR